MAFYVLRADINRPPTLPTAEIDKTAQSARLTVVRG